MLSGLCGAGVGLDKESTKEPGSFKHLGAFLGDPCECDHCTTQSYSPSEHLRKTHSPDPQVTLRLLRYKDALMCKVTWTLLTVWPSGPAPCRTWMSTPVPNTQASGEEGAWGHRILQRQIDLVYSDLGLFGLCAIRASLSWLLEWPLETLPGIARLQQSVQGSRPNAGLTLFLQLKRGTASVWEAISLKHCIDSPLPVSKCYAFTSKGYAALSAFYWAHCRPSFLGKKNTVKYPVFLFLSHI